MASSLLLHLSLLLGLLAISATARPGPCRTVIFFSTTTSNPFQNDLVYPQIPNLLRPRSITIFFTRIRPENPTISFDRPIIESEEDTSLPLSLYSSASASFRDRTKDILRVVGSLLFGVGCGALTAATLYLVWSLFASNQFTYDSDEESDADFDDVSPKKAGYVAIPAAEKLIPAKEVV